MYPCDKHWSHALREEMRLDSLERAQLCPDKNQWSVLMQQLHAFIMHNLEKLIHAAPSQVQNETEL